MSESKYAAAIAEIRRGRDQVDQLILALEQLEAGVPLLRAVSGLGLVGAPAARVEAPAVPAPSAARTPVTTAGRTLHAPPKTEAAAGMILDALQKNAGGPLLMKELLAQANVTSHLLREGVRLLTKRKQVVVTGQSRGKRVSLPKEGL